MEVYKVQAFAAANYSNEVFDNIAELAGQCLADGKFPYTQDIPLTPNKNIVNNHQLTSIQAIEMELKNALNGNTDQKWIFGADAVTLGLELKQDYINPDTGDSRNAHYDVADSGKPIILYANVLKNKSVSNKAGNNREVNVLKEGMQIDCQTAYSLSQFDTKSVAKALSFNHIKTSLELRGDRAFKESQRIAIAQAITENIGNNGIGPEETKLRMAKLNNFRANHNRDNPAFHKARQVYREYTEGLEPGEKKCFETLYNYFAKQQGIDVSAKSKAQDSDFRNLLENKGSVFFAKLLYNASAFAERLTHYDFSFEQLYEKMETQEKEKNLGFHMPNASRPEEISGLADLSLKERLKSQKSAQIQPRTITRSHEENMGR